MKSNQSVTRAIIWAAVSSKVQAHEDKNSIPTQIANAEKLCNQHNWQVIDTLVVNGHSRDYYTLDEVITATLKEGIKAFARLRDHIEARDFDVFVFFSADRIGRKSSLIHEIVGRVIGSGAKIYSMTDGWVDETNANIFTAFRGYETNSTMSRIRSGTKMGRKKLAERGLPISSTVPMTHKLIRNSSGKAVALEIVPENAQIMVWAAEGLIVEQLAYNELGIWLRDKYGVVAPDGNPFEHVTLYYLLHNPYLWGHSMYNIAKHRTAQWIYDESVPVPEGVDIWRNVVPPVFTGLLADRLKAELNRRKLITGRGKPRSKFIFSGIFTCAKCGRKLSKFNNLYKCSRSYSRSHGEVHSPCLPGIREEKFMDFFDMLIARLRESMPLVSADETVFVEDYTSAIKSVESRMENLISEITQATSETLKAMYRKTLHELDEQKNKLLALQEKVLASNTISANARYIAQQIPDDLWLLPIPVVNQLLHQLISDVILKVDENRNIIIIPRYK